MPASQQHGFEFQKILERDVFKLTELQQSYTAIHDIPKEYNRFDHTENVSIKVTGSNSIGMGDPLRIFDYSSAETHTAIIVYYLQTGDRKTVRKTVEITLDDKRALFGDIRREEIVDLVREIRSVPVGIPASELNARRKHINAMTKELSKRSAIRFNSKIDSKNQRRLQCTLVAIPDSILVSSENGAVVRSVWFTDHVVSETRTRNRRV